MVSADKKKIEKRPQQRSESGFTLLEVMVAVIIVGIGLLAVGSAEMTVVGTNRNSGNSSLITAAADEMIEKMHRNQTKLSSYNGMNTSSSATYSDASVQLDFTDWKSRVQNVKNLSNVAAANLQGQVQVAAGPIASTTRVTVTMTWTDIIARTLTVETIF
jgi:type IV pilus assembly protein PilV